MCGEAVKDLTLDSSFILVKIMSQKPSVLLVRRNPVRPRASYSELISEEESHTIDLLSIQIDKYKIDTCL